MAEIQRSSDGSVMIISLPISLDTAWAEKFSRIYKSWFGLGVKLFVFDFSQTYEIKNTVYPSLMQFVLACKMDACLLASFAISEGVLIKLTNEGLAASFNLVKSLAAAKELLPTEAKKSAMKLDVKFINPFISATIKTLEVQAQTKCRAGKPFLVKPDDKSYQPQVAIVGVIIIASNQFNGSLTLAFSEKVFLKIYENMLGEKQKKITPEIEDAAGELINIIYGTAKTELNASMGTDLQPALPTILSGEKIEMREKPEDLIIVLPFETESGQFQIEVAIASQT